MTALEQHRVSVAALQMLARCFEDARAAPVERADPAVAVVRYNTEMILQGFNGDGATYPLTIDNGIELHGQVAIAVRSGFSGKINLHASLRNRTWIPILASRNMARQVGRSLDADSVVRQRQSAVIVPEQSTERFDHQFMVLALRKARHGNRTDYARAMHGQWKRAAVRGVVGV